MNASRRWTYHFVACLECVECRKKQGLRLFNKWGDLITSKLVENYSIETLIESCDNLEVWCRQCAPDGVRPLSRRTQSEGRKKHKREAAHLASLRAATQIASRYDDYTLPDGTRNTKQELVRQTLDKSCQVCYDSPAVKLYKDGRNVASMASGSFTYTQVEQAIQNTVPCCPKCFSLLKKGNIAQNKTISINVQM